MIEVNGECHEGFDGRSVSELLVELGYRAAYIAVEMNGDIIKKDNYASVVLSDGDSLEIVNFVGGG